MKNPLDLTTKMIANKIGVRLVRSKNLETVFIRSHSNRKRAQIRKNRVAKIGVVASTLSRRSKTPKVRQSGSLKKNIN